MAVISGEPFVCLRPRCAEHRSMIVAPGRDLTAARRLFITANYSSHCVYLLPSVPPTTGTFQRRVISPLVISPSAAHSSNSALDKMSG